MRMKINTLTETQRTKALNTRTAKPVNPYLFDVRKDKEIVALLRECADYNMKVALPIGAYLIERHEAVQNMYAGSETYVLVNARGVCKYRDSGMDENYHNWLKGVKRFLGIKD